MSEDFDRDGVMVIRGAIPAHHMDNYLKAWVNLNAAARPRNRWNPVEIEGPFGNALQDLPSYLVPLATEALGDRPRVYNYRFVVKDDQSPGPVFLHQDCGYHIGSLPKLSAFVAFSSVIPENGGMVFWKGTHRYGYLGDVGEINPAMLGTAKAERFCPTLAPGDVVLMHSALWHESGPRTIALDRVMADIIYQRADDPAALLPREGLFVRSRSSRLAELQAKVDAMVRE